MISSASTRDDYRRRWRNLVIFDANLLQSLGLGADTCAFLSTVGLPTERAPMWNFNGTVSAREQPPGGQRYVEFGQYGVAPLLILPGADTVWVVREERGTPDYCNASVQQFARCLTLAIKGDPWDFDPASISVEELLARITARYEDVDATGMRAGTPWANLLLEAEEEEREIRGESDDG